jgi:1,4-alpha-glucan branching enzyme
MPLERRPSVTPGHVSVTLRVPAVAAARSVDVVGEFTDWRLVTMQADEDGSLFATFDLPVGRTYRFRYLIDGERWENDWAADSYVPNDYGGDDSVIDVRKA